MWIGHVSDSGFLEHSQTMVGVRANADTADITDAKWEDIDALSKIEALYHASEDADPDNHAEFTT